MDVWALVEVLGAAGAPEEVEQALAVPREEGQRAFDAVAARHWVKQRIVELWELTVVLPAASVGFQRAIEAAYH